MIKMVLFDLGGVVIYVPDSKYQSYLSKISGISRHEAHRRISVDTVPLERGDITLEKFNKTVADDLGIKPSQVLWAEHFKNGARLEPGTVNIIRRLKKNYRVSFLSNVDKSRYEPYVTRILRNIMPLFTFAFTSYKLRSIKPSPLIYRKVLGKMGLRPGEVVFIDNDKHNVYGAKKVGMKALIFTTPESLSMDLKRLGLKF